MDKIKELINDKNKEKNKVNRISNTVAMSPTQNADKARCDAGYRPKKSESKNESKNESNELNDVLNSIKKGEKKSRILIDWLSISITPLVPPSGVKNIGTADAPIRVPVDYDPDPELIRLYKDSNYTQPQKFFNRHNNLELELPDDFFDKFFDVFDFLDVKRDSYGKPEYEAFGANMGYNAGRKYTIFSHDKKKDNKVKPATLYFKFFDPDNEKVLSRSEMTGYVSRSAYTKNPAVANYIRQRINLSLTGDALQALREHGVFFKFVFTLYQTFLGLSVTRFDATLDLFNYGFKPKYFFNLYNKNRYLSQSQMSIVGKVDDPTVYIGRFKQSRTIMIYDKVAENKDNRKSDEPELLNAVTSGSKNTWVRFEQIFTGSKKEATQVFDHLVGNLWEDDKLRGKVWSDDSSSHIFYGRLASLLRTEFSKKCRFLKKPRDSHPERIENDRRWQSVLDALSSVDSDFTFKRPELTLEELKNNFIKRSLGGPKLFGMIYEIEGPEALAKFVEEVVNEGVVKYNREQ